VSYLAAGKTYVTSIRTNNGRGATSLSVTYDPGGPTRVAVPTADPGTT